ncbi:hypothetical protein ES705_30645 [subsurface metagenome]
MAIDPTQYNKLAVTNPSTNLSEVVLLINFNLTLSPNFSKPSSMPIISPITPPITRENITNNILSVLRAICIPIIKEANPRACTTIFPIFSGNLLFKINPTEHPKKIAITFTMVPLIKVYSF